MAVATYQDVATAIGRPISDQDEQAQVEWWLNGIELVIIGRLGDVSELSAEVVRYVESEVVAEKVRRAGQAESSITVAVDDGSVTRRYDSPPSDADISAEWWALLGYRLPRAKSMRVTGGDLFR